MTQDVMEWLKTVRKLDGRLLETMGVKAVDHPGLGQVVAFPYQRDGRAYAAKFRTAEKQFRSSEGVSRGLYNSDDLYVLQDLPIVITEGEIDCLSVMQAGFERAVSLPDGWTEDGGKRDVLVQVEDALRKSPYVIVAGDNDDAGRSLPREVAKMLRGHDVRFAEWPEGCKDPNDVLMKFGEGALATCLNASKRIDPPGGLITGLSDLPPMADRRVLRVSEAPFDRVVALELGAMSVWTGVPGSGKSTFLTWAAERVSVEENIRVGVMAFETHPHDLRDQLSLIRTGKEFSELDEQTRKNLTQSVDDRFRFVHVTLDQEGQQHLKWLDDMIHALAVRDGCKLIIVDPWNELEHLPEPGENMTQYVNFATKFIRQIAERLDVHIALVAHPRKMPTDRGDRVPTGYDIADSAAFFNKPSLGVTVHQRERADEESGEVEKWVELNVWKVRKTRLYKFNKGKVTCNFDAARMGYTRRSAQ